MPRKRSKKPAEFSVGGQAIIEGVMMRAGGHWSMAVRRKSGEIHSDVWPVDSFVEHHPWLKRPFLRGFFVLVDTMVLGFKALQKSADIALEDVEEELRAEETAAAARGGEETLETVLADEQQVEKIEKEKKVINGKWVMIPSLILGLGFFIVLFILLPTWITPSLTGGRQNVNRILFNLVEGLLRLGVFMLYLLLVSLIKDIRRFFQYHGAEHKSIHVWEHGLPLEPESARQMGTAHVRCGTGFLLLTLVLTILIYSVVPITTLWLRVVSRVALLPFVAGISYEIIKLADKRRKSLLVRAIVAPGMWLQKLTTRQPDDEQVEVAMHALRVVLEAEGKIRQSGEG